MKPCVLRVVLLVQWQSFLDVASHSISFRLCRCSCRAGDEARCIFANQLIERKKSILLQYLLFTLFKNFIKYNQEQQLYSHRAYIYIQDHNKSLVHYRYWQKR